MALSPNVELTSLEDLLLQQLQDLYAAEQHQAQALPKMVDAASAHQLKSALQDHFAETKQHVSRLETIFEMLEKPATGDPGEAMQGLLKEANCTVQAQGDA
ncbi:MAG: DUF892 family protein, partial [Planctomycetales bacterium]|nr:DUF892 family protein [Planctomycetales bacterium]